ncbi:MAG: hydantoinase/oxoprolinase family protein [Gammaproteobacteria bacterium]|nr:MAG: hydantoinase/oxoprolinase family protein [Gammaproteobacteria bacterium]
MLLGVDTGGTFTDFVLLDGNSLRVHKVLSTPDSPEKAILQGIKELGITDNRLRVVHGSTVATNALLEGKGVKTLFITNRGFKDLLTIGRQARKELYNLCPQPAPPPIPESLCIETGGRLSAEGEILDPLSQKDLKMLCGQVEQLAPESVAINLLFSFLDDRAEKEIEAALPENLFISRSSAVLPEYKEYERGIATWLNSYVGPLVNGYLARLCNEIEAESVSVMQSSGGTIRADQAGQQAVNMLLSGPAGGLVGALRVGELAGHHHLLTFDMGGTSTDVALIDGEIPLTNEGKIAGYPVAVPMVDMHTIGAGGGSIASIDGGGLLSVGPESAGALPGPACYGKGGGKATVTDANVVLGRLLPEHFLGGSMTLDKEAAHCTVGKIAEELGYSTEEAAEGIVQIANEHMARALRVISVQRGVDPRHFRLASFGGAGGLHVCALAEALEMNSAIVPIHGGVLSAFGMIAAPRSRQFSHTLTGLLEKMDWAEVETLFLNMENAGCDALATEGVSSEKIRRERAMDLRYLGQSYTLKIPTGPLAQIQSQFHKLHQARYGHSLDLPIELVNLRLAVSGEMPQPTLTPLKRRGKALIPAKGLMPVYEREKLLSGDEFHGPAIVTEKVATTYIGSGWKCKVDNTGNLLLDRVG